jgi:hypothetical protein
MLPAEDLFVYVYVLVDDAISSQAVAIAPRPGPAPACTDAEPLAVALVRHLLGRRSEAGFLAEVARDWAHLFPKLPHQSEANRRIRWLWGASGQLRALLAARLPVDDCQQVDTTALPVKHTSRVRGADGWTGPGNDLAARFGRDAAHAEGSTASGWLSRPASARGSSGPGASCPPRSTSARSPATCSRPGRHRLTCCAIRVSTAGRSLPPRPPAAPESWSRPPSARGRIQTCAHGPGGRCCMCL